MKTLIHQLGEEMLRQGVLPFKYEVDECADVLAVLGRLPMYPEAFIPKPNEAL